MSRRARTVLVWLVLVAVFLGVYVSLGGTGEPATTTLPEVFTAAQEHHVTTARFDGRTLVVAYDVGGERRAELGNYDRDDVREFLRGQGVTVRSGSSDDSRTSPLLLAIGVLVVAIVVLVVLRMRNQGGLQSVFSLRRTNAKRVDKPPEVTFADVGGNEEAKLRLRDVVGFLKEPERWQKTGARAPRGVLLEGPPGLGKTLLARALAGEAKVPLFTSSGADFVELFVGVGAARVRDLFEVAQKQAPCIIFIDELDALGRKRGAASASLMHQEREQTLNQLLVCLDGFTPLSKVIVVAATNRADVLDPALLRPGRFDVRLRMTALSTADRRRVLELHTRNKTLGPDVDLDRLAQQTEGLSGADLEHLANEAALNAVRGGRDRVPMTDFQVALAAREQAVEVDKLDAALLEGTHQLSRPTAPVRLTVALDDGVLEGELLWVDPSSLKLKTATGAVVVSRQAVRRITALAGTGAATLDELQRSSTELGTA
jgi:cell division protease FtsH